MFMGKNIKNRKVKNVYVLSCRCEDKDNFELIGVFKNKESLNKKLLVETYVCENLLDIDDDEAYEKVNKLSITKLKSKILSRFYEIYREQIH